MTRIEIETITDAMTTKQTWIKKELQDFLDVWEEITKEEISGFKYLKLMTIDGEHEDETIYLERGCACIIYNPASEAYGYYEHVYNLNDMDSIKVRQICEILPQKLNRYFKDIQEKIDEYSLASQGIAEIIKKLK